MLRQLIDGTLVFNIISLILYLHRLQRVRRDIVPTEQSVLLNTRADSFMQSTRSGILHRECKLVQSLISAVEKISAAKFVGLVG